MTAGKSNDLDGLALQENENIEGRAAPKEAGWKLARNLRSEANLAARFANSMSRRGRHSLAIRLSGIRPIVHLYGRFPLANSLYHAERYEEAVAEFSTELQKNPNNDDAASRMATAAIRAGDAHGLKVAAESVLRARVPRPRDLVRLAREIRECDHDLAESLFDHAFEEWGSSEAHDEIISTHEAMGDAQWRILELMLAGESLHEDDKAWTWKLAKKLASAKRFDEAVARCEKIDGNLDSEQLYQYAIMVGSLGRLEQKRSLQAKSLTSAKDENVKKFGIGVYYEREKIWYRAAEHYIEQLSLTSDHSVRTELYLKIGYCYEAELDYPTACQYFERAIGLEPNSSQTWFKYGRALELDDQLDRAYGAYQMAISLSDGDRQDIEFRAGYIRWKQSRYASSYEHLLRFALAPAELLAAREIYSERTDFATLGDGFRKMHGEGPRPSESLNSHRHSEWADLFFSMGDFDRSAAYYRMSYIAGGLSRARLGKWMIALEAEDRLEEACRVGVEWRSNPEPTPQMLGRPRRSGFEARNIRYANYRKNLAIRHDVVAYESSLGLSVDCNPLAICRKIMKSHPGAFIHVWFVEPGVPLPADLQQSPDVITVHRDSDQALRVLASAAYLVNNSTFPTHPVLRAEQRYMNTWHGTPLKMMMKDAAEPLGHSNVARNFLQSTALIYANEHTLNTVVGSSDVLPLVVGKTHFLGSPRNDALASLPEAATSDTPGPKTVLLAPTWRPDSDLDVEVEKLNELYSQLKRPGRRILVRAHHYIESKLARLGLGFEIVPRSMPTVDLLPEVDVLVTDYSSIFFDYALTRRPIVFYVPDWDEYKSSRGLYLEKTALPGCVCETAEEVDAAIDAGTVPQGVDDFLEKYAPRDDGRSSERAVHELLTGPTFGDLIEREEEGKAVLLRGEFRANGITSALIAMANSLAHKNIQVAVATNTAAVRADESRQQQLAKLEASIPVLGRVGPMVSTALEYHARQLAQRRAPNNLSRNVQLLVDATYKVESLRVLGTSLWTSVVEYEGYSDFWADFILGCKRQTNTSGIFIHSDIVAESEMKFPWLLRIAQRYPRFDSAVAVSKDLAEINMGKLEGLIEGEVRIQPARNVVDYSRIEAESEESYDTDLADFIDGAESVVLAVGRLSPEKNHDFLIDVAERVTASGRDVRFLVCGDGPLRGQLQTKIDTLDLNGNFLLAGQRECVYSLMRRADIFVLPSLHEGQSIVLLECAVIGTPAIASEIESARAFNSMGVQTERLNAPAWARLILNHLDGNSVIPRTDGNMRSYVEASIAEFKSAVGL